MEGEELHERELDSTWAGEVCAKGAGVALVREVGKDCFCREVSVTSGCNCKAWRCWACCCRATGNWLRVRLRLGIVTGRLLFGSGCGWG